MNTLSIITLNLNNIAGLRKTAHSVQGIVSASILSGSFSVEWIIVDGGSTDGSLGFIGSLPLTPVVIVGKDHSIYNAMNLGIAACSSAYMLFLNSGDYLIGDYCIFGDMQAGLIFSSVTEGLWLRRFSSYPSWLGLPASHQSIVFPVCPGIFYDEQFTLSADYEFYLRMLRSGVSFVYTTSLCSVVEDGGVSRLHSSIAFRQSQLVRKRYYGLAAVFVAYMLRFSRRALKSMVGYC